MSGTNTDPVLRIAELADEIDGGFAAIRERRSAWMECRSGCSDCCRARLSITRVEEALLRRGLAELPQTTRDAMASAATDPAREMCPALDDQGRCRVYASRPMICRSYGVPLRHRREVSLVNPPVIDVCDKNFVDTPLKMLPDRDVLDQTDLDRTVSEIDAEFCLRNELPVGERVPIAQILATPDVAQRPAPGDAPREPTEIDSA